MQEWAGHRAQEELERRLLRGTNVPNPGCDPRPPSESVSVCSGVEGGSPYIINSPQWEGVKAPEKPCNTPLRQALSTMCPPGRQD